MHIGRGDTIQLLYFEVCWRIDGGTNKHFDTDLWNSLASSQSCSTCTAIVHCAVCTLFHKIKYSCTTKIMYNTWKKDTSYWHFVSYTGYRILWNMPKHGLVYILFKIRKMNQILCKFYQFILFSLSKYIDKHSVSVVNALHLNKKITN